MTLLLDQGIPRRAAQLLRDAGIECHHAADVGLSTASDAEIVACCRQRTWIAVTLDADFHSLVALSGLRSPSVVRLRIEGLQGPAVARLLCELLLAHKTPIEGGALITVEAERVRIRRLPIAVRPGRRTKRPAYTG